MNSTSELDIWLCQQWWRIFSIASAVSVQRHSPPKPDTRTVSAVRQLKSGSIRIWKGRMLWYWAGHVNVQFTPWKTRKKKLPKKYVTALQPFRGQQMQALFCLTCLNVSLVSSPSSHYFLQLSLSLARSTHDSAHPTTHRFPLDCYNYCQTCFSLQAATSSLRNVFFFNYLAQGGSKIL